MHYIKHRTNLTAQTYYPVLDIDFRALWLSINTTLDIWDTWHVIKSFPFSSVAQLCPTLCDLDCSPPGFPVQHQLPELAQTHVHQVSDAIQPSHPLLSPSPPASNLSQHQGLFQWVSSSHQVAKVLQFQLQYQSFQWIQFHMMNKMPENIYNKNQMYFL